LKKRFVPRKRIRERFSLIYELEGCQKAVDYLTAYYGIKRMRVVLDGRRVGNGDRACYYRNKAFFTKNGLNKRTVAHELYHHIAESLKLDMTLTEEERKASIFSRILVHR
jgi:hypothetical protein